MNTTRFLLFPGQLGTYCEHRFAPLAKHLAGEVGR